MERELSGGANYARECATMLSILNMNYHKWNMNFSKIFIPLPVQGAIKTGHGGIAAKTKNSTYTVEYITKEIGLFFFERNCHNSRNLYDYEACLGSVYYVNYENFFHSREGC